jgi:4a-hydroxytetrahydrobiopterin dehydratase
VDIRLISHDVNAVTDRDLTLAGRISALAREQGIDADPSALQVVDLGLDTADSARIAPFWAALLTGDASNVGEVGIIDPTGQAPRVWFQPADPHEVPHQRFHPDVWVPAAEAADRIRAAVAAGGRIVDDSGQPRFTVLADADGNRACVCSLEGR